MQDLTYILLIVLAIWLVGVTFVLYKIFALFEKLTKGVGVHDLKTVLEKVIAKEQENSLKTNILNKRIRMFEDSSKLFVQKVGFVRFNPFKELGGDHSSSLAILDGDDSGVVITSLHTRDRTRVYMKDIKKGKSTFELSSEEKKALQIAQKTT